MKHASTQPSLASKKNLIQHIIAALMAVPDKIDKEYKRFYQAYKVVASCAFFYAITASVIAFASNQPVSGWWKIQGALVWAFLLLFHARFNLGILVWIGFLELCSHVAWGLYCYGWEGFVWLFALFIPVNAMFLPRRFAVFKLVWTLVPALGIVCCLIFLPDWSLYPLAPNQIHPITLFNWLAVILTLTLNVGFYNRLVETATREAEAARSKAEDASRAKSLFLATMSHEIRTPMHGVLGMAQLLTKTKLDERQQELATSIFSAGDSLMTILNDILDFSKIEADRIELEQLPFRLRHCLDSVNSIFKSKVMEKGLSLRITIDPSVPEFVKGDETRFRQILINLVGNAIKFTPAGGILIECYSSHDPDSRDVTLTVSVHDTGIGIPKDKLSALFQSFQQLDASTSREYGGTGLGLAISKRLANLMGGDLGVESAGPGHGSCFTVTIRVTQAHESEIIAAPQPSALPGSVHERPPLDILLVDDFEFNRTFAQYALEELGYTTRLATHGREVVERFEKEGAELIFMDVQMPLMDGMEATRIIRGMNKPQPYIIAMTANAMPGDRESCIAAGMDDFLSKPVKLEHLAAAISRALDYKAAGAFSRQSPNTPTPSESLQTAPFSHDLGKLLKFESRPSGRQLIAVYLRDSPTVINHADTAIKAEDYQALGRLAHAFKGSNAYLGFDSLVILCTRLEALAKLGQPGMPDALHLLQTIREQYEIAASYLTQD